MRVCFIGDSPTPTTRVRGHEFAKYLRRYGFETKVLQYWEGPGGLKLCGPARIIKPPILSAKLLGKIMRYKPDIIYLLKPLIPAALTASAAQKLLGSHFFFDIDDFELREWFHPIRNEILLRSEKYLAAHANAIIVASRMLAQRVSSFGVFDHKIHYIPTGVDTDFFKPRKIDKKSGKKILIFTGIRSKEYFNNILLMLRALRSMARERKDFEVWLTGKGEAVVDDAIMKFIDKAHLTSNILLTGWIAQEELPRLLAQADIVLHPLANSFLNQCKSPTKLFEYMAMGLPVVSSNIGEADLIIEHGKNGMLCGDAEEFARNILTLLEDDRLARRIGKSARKTVQKKYSLTILSKKLASIMRCYE